MKILFLGEIVGKSGIYAIKKALKDLVVEREIDFVLANGDSTTGESGLGRGHAVYLRKLGVQAITGGDKIYSKVDLVENFSQIRHVLRPANYSSQSPGSGLRFFSINHQQVAVITLLGQAWHKPTCDNPFTVILRILEKVKIATSFVVVDFHSYSTAEKQSMRHILDGKVSLLVGTGQKVQTTDARITPGLTAAITDVGRCGSMDSVGGLVPEVEIRKLVTSIFEPSQISDHNLALQGIVVTLNEEGKAVTIESITVPVKSPSDSTDQSVQTSPADEKPNTEEK